MRVSEAHSSSPVTRTAVAFKSAENRKQMRTLTAGATGDTSMSRCGLMELIFQGALPVGSGVGTTGPIWSLESIRGPNNGEPLREFYLRCFELVWGGFRSPSGRSSSPSGSYILLRETGEQQLCSGGKHCALSLSLPLSLPPFLIHSPLRGSLRLC